MNATPHLIAGRYEVGELLGRGGMAEVRKGTDVRLGRTVAIKQLRTELAGDPTFQARFRREAKSSASLNHPSIVAVYDTGEEYVEEHGQGVAQPYIVMEYVAGRTLRDILREGRKILPERALEITAGVLAALDYSHRMGIIHRDIKPANVMLTPTGEVKVMDFGIARALADAQSTMTQTAAVVGTAQYLSPEQARGESVDFRSDVYSAGCLLFELLTGRPPFTGDTPVAIAYQHVREQPLPPSTYDDELSPEIDAIAMKALTKSLADRYQSAAAMKSDIDRCLAGKPVTAPAVAPTNWPTEVVAATDANPATTAMLPAATNRPPAPVDLEPKRRKRTGLWVTLAVGLVVLLTAAAVFLPRLWNQAPPEVLVPDVTNSNQVLATATLQDAKLKVGQITEATSDTVKEGDVISTDPEAGTSVPENSTVDLVISTGKPAVTLPDDMIGRPGSEVEAELIALGLRVKVIPQESDLPLDQVISTSPAEGEQVAANGRVKLYVSDGPETVPDLVGKTQAEAEQLILAAGFKPHVVENPNSIEPAGTVIHQSPSVGQTLPAGSEVTIEVSTADPFTETPGP